MFEGLFVGGRGVMEGDQSFFIGQQGWWASGAGWGGVTGSGSRPGCWRRSPTCPCCWTAFLVVQQLLLCLRGELSWCPRPWHPPSTLPSRSRNRWTWLPWYCGWSGGCHWPGPSSTWMVMAWAGRWPLKGCRRCSAPPLGRGDSVGPSQMGSWWWLSPRAGSSRSCQARSTAGSKLPTQSLIPYLPVFLKVIYV